MICCSSLRLSAIDFFEGTYEEALALAQKEEKNIFINFTATWCAPCQQMRKTVLAEADITAYARQQFVSLKIDIDTPFGGELFAEYGFQGVPSYVVITPDQKPLAVYSGSMDHDTFMKFLKLELAEAKPKTPEEAARLQEKAFKESYQSFADFSNLVQVLNRAKQFDQSISYLNQYEKQYAASEINTEWYQTLKEYAIQLGEQGQAEKWQATEKLAQEKLYTEDALLVKHNYYKAKKDYQAAAEALVAYITLDKTEASPKDHLIWSLDYLISYGVKDQQAAFALEHYDLLQEKVNKYEKWFASKAGWTQESYLYHRARLLAVAGQCAEAKAIAQKLLPSYDKAYSSDVAGTESPRELQRIITDCQ